jgi:hypothetical protein
MLINLLAFILLIIVLCGGIWFWVRKNVQPISDTYLRHSPSGGMVMPVKKEQPEEKPQTKQSAAVVFANVPTATETVNERWRDWLALSTTIIAVITVIMSLAASRATMLAVYASSKETNQWLLYQTKGIKEYSYQISKAAFELELTGTSAISAEAAEKYRQTIKKYDEEIKRYKDEKEEIMQEALSMGKTKEKNIKQSAGFVASIVFLLIAILLSSIAAVVRKKYIWYIGLSMLAGWSYFFINGI